MYRILIITDQLVRNNSANANIAKKIGDELKRRGHSIVYVSTSEYKDGKQKIDNTDIFTIKESQYKKLLNKINESNQSILYKIYFYFIHFLRKIKCILIINKFPDVNLRESKKIFNIAKHIHEKENFDCIIGVFRPFSGVSAAINMKRYFKDILCCAYYLDLISGSVKPTLIPNKVYNKLCYNGELRAFKNIDCVLMAKAGKNIYDDDKYNSVNNKIKYIDFPLFYENSLLEHTSKKFELNYINLVYAGTLDKNYRNPEYLLKILESVSKSIPNLCLHIYGKGNCNDIVNKYKKNSNYKIEFHGMVSQEVVKNAMNEANIVINISNKVDNIVPSKIFELFSTGKPIINILSNKSDFSLSYFEKYPGVINIKEYEDIENQSEALIKYINQRYKHKYDISKLKEVFIENTPEFTVDIIENQINMHKRGYLNYVTNQ